MRLKYLWRIDGGNNIHGELIEVKISNIFMDKLWW